MTRLGRFGNPEDLGVVVFASPAAACITGQTIGGRGSDSLVRPGLALLEAGLYGPRMRSSTT